MCFAAALIYERMMGVTLFDLNRTAEALGSAFAMWSMGGGVAFAFRKKGGSDKRRLLLIWVVSSAIFYFFALVGSGIIELGDDRNLQSSIHPVINKYLEDMAETLPIKVDEHTELTGVELIGTTVFFDMKVLKEVSIVISTAEGQSLLAKQLSWNLCNMGISKKLFLENKYVIVYRYRNPMEQLLMEFYISIKTCKDLAIASEKNAP